MYAQLQPSPYTSRDMREYEAEWSDPRGIRTISPAPPRIDGVLVSEKCALLIRVDGLATLRCEDVVHYRYETLTYRASGSTISGGSLSIVSLRPRSLTLYHLALLMRFVDAGTAFVIYLILLGLAVNQMEWTATPRSISKISRWGFVIQCVLDSYGSAGVSYSSLI
jgi:hypothetical protein